MFGELSIGALEEYVHSFMAQHGIPGLSIALAKNEQVLFAKGYGYRNATRKKLVSADTIFGIASVTKAFTAIALAQLADMGLLSFDDAITRHIPEFRMPGSIDAGVTIREMLTHTSGMPALDALQVSFSGHSSPDAVPPQPSPCESVPINTYHDLVNYIAQSPSQLLGKPGERFSYSNECYAILGALIKRVSGIPYAAFVRENILQPMSMYRTTFSFEEMYEHDDVTALYDILPDGSLRESTRWPCAPAFQAGGRLKSSAPELLRLFQMLASGGTYLGKRFLTEESWRQTISPGHQYALRESYGHALITRPHYHGVTLIGHGGMGKGISAYGGFVPEEGYSAVVLCNLSGVPAIQLFGAVINMALGLPIDTPRNQYETSFWSPKQIEQCIGIYGSDEGNEFVVTASDERLILLHNGVSTVVKRVTDDVGVFDAKGFEQELRFYRDSNGSTVGVGHDVRFIPRKE